MTGLSTWFATATTLLYEAATCEIPPWYRAQSAGSIRFSLHRPVILPTTRCHALSRIYSNTSWLPGVFWAGHWTRSFQAEDGSTTTLDPSDTAILTLSAPEAIVEAALGGIGVAQVAVHLAWDHLVSGKLKVVLRHQHHPGTYEMAIQYPHRALIAPRVRAVVDYLLAGGIFREPRAARAVGLARRIFSLRQDYSNLKMANHGVRTPFRNFRRQGIKIPRGIASFEASPADVRLARAVDD